MPNVEMTIFEVLKAIKKGIWYQVPADFNGTAYISVDSNEAGKQLVHLRTHWAKQDVPTTFEMADAIEMPVWNSTELKMVIRPLVRVRIINDKIKDRSKEIF